MELRLCVRAELNVSATYTSRQTSTALMPKKYVKLAHKLRDLPAIWHCNTFKT